MKNHPSSLLIVPLLLLSSSPIPHEAFSSSSSSPASSHSSSLHHATTTDERRRNHGLRIRHDAIPSSSFYRCRQRTRRRGTMTSSTPLHFAPDPPAIVGSDGGSSSTSPNDVPTSDPPHPPPLARDAIINVVVLLLVGLYVLERIFSVEYGITRGWSPSEIAQRLPLDNWASYSRLLDASPVETKAITSATVYALGDVLSQRSNGSGLGKLDRGRILRSLLAGLIGHGPMSHVWYNLSENFFDDVLRMDRAWWDFVPRVILDQAVFGPIWNNSYILLLGIMQLHDPRRIWDDMKRTTLPLILSGLRLWPFVHIITYGVIPIENRLLWVDAVEIVWVTILASTASSSPPPTTSPPPSSSSTSAGHSSSSSSTTMSDEMEMKSASEEVRG